MKIDATQPIKDYKNENVVQGENKEVLTFREVFLIALNNVDPNEKLQPEKKSRMFGLAVKICATEEVDLKVDEAALLKERCAIICAPLVYGRVCELLDGAKVKK